jgi:uncharacterized protein
VPTVLALISELFFSVQVESAAKSLGWDCVTVDDLSKIPVQPHLNIPIGKPTVVQNSPLGHNFIAYVVELTPVLIVIDLSSTLPWEPWVIAAKTSPATRRIPILAFGPHVDPPLLKRARDAGCNAVVTKGQFSTQLPGILQEHARLQDPEAMKLVGDGELSPLAKKGIELFNAREYFDAHEELEHAWLQEEGPVRELYRGILQIAVAYLQITRRNYNGAIKMFLRSRQWLDPLPDVSRGVDVESLRTDALEVRAKLEALGPERIGEFDVNTLKPVKLLSDQS